MNISKYKIKYSIITNNQVWYLKKVTITSAKEMNLKHHTFMIASLLNSNFFKPKVISSRDLILSNRGFKSLRNKSRKLSTIKNNQSGCHNSNNLIHIQNNFLCTLRFPKKYWSLTKKYKSWSQKSWAMR